VENVNDVKTSLIESRRIIFTPSVDLKDELANTAIQITCIDRNGKEVKRVNSSDAGTIEDPENGSTESGSTESGSNGSTENGGSQNGGSQSGGDNGGNSGGGDNGGGDGEDTDMN
jgi:hypothetical protein